MKCTDPVRLVALKSIVAFPCRCALVAILLGGAVSARAESVIAPAPAAPEIPPGGPGVTGEVLKAPSSAPIQWGAVGVRPHAFYRLSYGDGVQTSPGNQAATTINLLSPGLAFDLGTHWTADYTPTWTFYSNRAFNNTVAHNASVGGTAGFTDGTLHFTQTYSKSADPLVETGRQTRQENASTSLGVSYALGQRSRIDADVGRNLSYVEHAPNTRAWTTQEWLHYQFSSRLDMAVGVGLGAVSVDPGADMRYSTPQVRIGWRPVDKLSLDIHGGREHRTFKGPGLGSLNSPTYGASITYQPIEVMSFSFSANRGVSASYFSNQVNDNSSWSLGFDQRLLQKFHLSGSYGRNNMRYIPTGPVLVVGRHDESKSMSLRLSTSFLRRGTIGLVYQRIENTSNSALFEFSSDQTGLEIGYRF